MRFPFAILSEVASRCRLACLPLVLACIPLNAAPAVTEDAAIDHLPPSSALRQGLRPVPLPRLAGMDDSVALALEQARAKLDERIADADLPNAKLAELFGSMGQLYQAHLVHDAARICYENAALLAPEDYRWPYYLGYLAQQDGRLEEARDGFGTALALRPDMPPAWLRLGAVHLQLGQWEEARALLLAAAADPELQGAALFELGKLAYAQREYAQAADWLEQAREASPTATRIEYTLALTYRSLGDTERARDAMRRRGDREPPIPDPLVDSLATLSTGQRMLFHYGMDAGHRKEYAMAVEMFRQGLELEPENVDARVSFARFLYLTGDRLAARDELREAVRRMPDHPLANFFLGLLYRENGDSGTAVIHYERTLATDPEHAGAHFFLGEVLLEEGTYAAAARHFRAVLQQDPAHSAARLREILALILAGEPHEAIRDRLEETLERTPDGRSFSYLLAALLAASPEPGIRDGARALALAEELYDQYPSPEHAELLAVALAETGDFAGAVSHQEEALQKALASAQWFLLPRLNRNLAEFMADRPCRVPWEAERLVFVERPANSYRVFRDYPAATPF